MNGNASGKAQASRSPVSRNDPTAFKSGDIEWRCGCVSRALHYPLSIQIGVYRNLPSSIVGLCQQLQWFLPLLRKMKET